MTTDIVKTVGEVEDKYKKALDEIKQELGEQNFNIETILSNLEQKASFIGAGTLNSLKKNDFNNLHCPVFWFNELESGLSYFAGRKLFPKFFLTSFEGGQKTSE